MFNLGGSPVKSGLGFSTDPRLSSPRSSYFLDALNREPGVDVLLALDLERSQRNQGVVVKARRTDAETQDFLPHELAGALPAWSGDDAWSPQSYDFSGLGNHAVQTIAGNQPKLVTSEAYVGGLEFRASASLTLATGVTFGLHDIFTGIIFKRSLVTWTGGPKILYAGTGNSRISITMRDVGTIAFAFVSNSGLFTTYTLDITSIPATDWVYAQGIADRDGLLTLTARGSSGVTVSTPHDISALASEDLSGDGLAYIGLGNIPAGLTLRKLYLSTGIPSQATIDRFLNLPIPD